MYKPPLERSKLPLNMSAGLAKDLALIITGHSKETDLVRYTALAMHYVSWTINKDATIREYEERLMGLSVDSSESLLDVLTLPTAFALQGLDNAVPRSLVKDAQKIASDWRKALAEKGCDAVKLHQRAMVLIADMLGDEHELQDSTAADIRMAVIHRHPEVQMREALNGSRPGSGAGSESGSGLSALEGALTHQGGPTSLLAGGPNGPQVHQFSNPMDALRFVFQQLNASRTGPGAPQATPGSAVQERISPPEVDPTKPTRRLFNPVDAVAMLQNMPATMPGEGNAQQRRVLDRMSNDTGWRALSEVPENDPLNELYERFPHFVQVLDYVKGSLALAACGDDGRPARVAPMLLKGEPGTGKTYFAQELARVLGSHFVERDMSVTSEAFVLSGMDSSWKNSKPGVVFEALVNGKTANPVICLNEVDKARATSTHNSPMAALYALLEPASAERFVDEFVPLKIDASQVIWVLTANHGDVPEPIMSRLETFDISAPTPDQCRAIGQSVWKGICQKLLPRGHGFSETLDNTMLDVLAAMSPRIMRKALTSAASQAALGGRKTLMAEDLAGSGSRYRMEGRPRSIGFQAQM